MLNTLQATTNFSEDMTTDLKNVAHSANTSNTFYGIKPYRLYSDEVSSPDTKWLTSLTSRTIQSIFICYTTHRDVG